MGPPLVGKLVMEFASGKEVRLRRYRRGRTFEIPFQIRVSDLSDIYIYGGRRIY
jgi:hypothetical protein